jgi:predicted MPP superfamily phosphohydrolase
LGFSSTQLVQRAKQQWHDPSRRKFLKVSAAAVTTVGASCLGYGYAVSENVQLSHVDVPIRHLSPEFHGLTIGHLSDIHHGMYTGADYIRRCVALLNQQQPDLVALTGDFTFGRRTYIEPCADVLSELKPRIGTYAVLGNHDYYQGAGHVARALRRVNINLLIDERERLEVRGARLSLLGVDDLYYGQTDVLRLLRDIPNDEPKVVLAHNPDFIEEFAVKNAHIDLMMSGHTHGGQIRLPLVGAPHIDSDYGQRYAIGMNRCREMQIYTTRGIGTITLPVRLDCPPEIVLYRLRAA